MFLILKFEFEKKKKKKRNNCYNFNFKSYSYFYLMIFLIVLEKSELDLILGNKKGPKSQTLNNKHLFNFNLNIRQNSVLHNPHDMLVAT